MIRIGGVLRRATHLESDTTTQQLQRVSWSQVSMAFMGAQRLWWHLQKAFTSLWENSLFRFVGVGVKRTLCIFLNRN